MFAISGFLVFILGLAIGSFLNCLVYRINKEDSLRGLLKGRSYCPKCKKQLLWYDNIPLLSFIFLKGNCRWCHFSIGVHYPLVELLTGVLSLMVYKFLLTNQISDFPNFLAGGQFSIPHFTSLSQGWLNGFLGGIYYFLITYALIAVFLSDLLYRTIPDQIIYPAIVIALIWSIVNSQWLMILSGIGGAAFFFLLVLLTRFKGMGVGDVKLAGLMGLFLGFPQIILAFYLAFLTGATVGVILILLGKKKLKSQIAFGPFLVVASFISWFCGEKIIKILGF